MSVTPRYAPIPVWCEISGMGRSVTYEELGRKKLRAIKLGSRTLIDVEHGLAYLASMPAAEINTGRTRRPPIMMPPPRERQTEAEAPVAEIGHPVASGPINLDKDPAPRRRRSAKQPTPQAAEAALTS